MAASAQTLFTEAKCFSCLGGVSAAQTMRMALLTQISDALGANMTTQELINEGQCFLCIPGVSLADTVELALLSQISDDIGGGGGGGSNNINGAGSPVGAITPAAINQIYRSDTGPGFWQATGLTSSDWILWSGVDG